MAVKNPMHKAVLKSLQNMQKTSKKTIIWGINDTAKTYQGKVPGILKGRYKITVPNAKKQIKLIKATQKRSYAVVSISRNPPSLAPYMKKRGKNLAVQVIKGNVIDIEGAFIRKMKYGTGDATKTVYVVLMRKLYPSQKEAYPTKGLHAASAGSMLFFLSAKNEAEIDTIIEKRAKKIMEDLVYQ